MNVSKTPQDRITDELRALLAGGQLLGDALRELHGVRGLGLMWLITPVEVLCGLPRSEALRTVFRETWKLRYPSSE